MPEAWPGQEHPRQPGNRGRYVTLRIADDGVGLAKTNNGHEGTGLRIMRYRAGQIGAQLSIRPGATQGTTVTCTIF